jgi:hypothetical protein
MKAFLKLVLFCTLTSCSAQSGANFISGAQTACTNAETGLTVITAADPSVAAHNSKLVTGIVAGCAAIAAVPISTPAP